MPERNRRHVSSANEPGGDVGFVAAVGAYVAAVLVTITLTVGLTLETRTSTLLGAVTTVLTVGIVAGAVASSRLEGGAERLGSRSRWLAGCFLAPAAFTALASIAAVFPSAPQSTAIGASVGAVLTFVVAVGIVQMSRTRYARAMTTGDPLASFPVVAPNQGRGWTVAGLLCFTVAAFLAHPDTAVFTRIDVVHREPFWWFVVIGGFSLLVGASMHLAVRRTTGDGTGILPDRLLPDPSGHKVAGKRYSLPQDTEPTEHTELEVHENGLVVETGMTKRFVPWSAVTEVRLTPEELVVSRRHWFDLRCVHSVIDDPEGAYETIKQARTDASRSHE